MRLLAALLLALLFAGAAQAQDALPVANCGTLPLAYNPGVASRVTVNLQGQLCISGTINATSSTTVNTNAVFSANNFAGGSTQSFLANQFGALFTQDTFNGQPVDATHGLPVNIVAGGGSGGTASSFAAAFPATGTAIGVKNGANMVNLAADASNNLLVNLQTALPAGSNAIGTVTANQGTANTVANAWPEKVTDGTNTAAVKAASTAPAATDPALVVAVSPNTPALPVTLTATTVTNDVTVQGDVANGAADTGNPVKDGGVAHTALPTAVTDGQRVNGMRDKFGRDVITGADRALVTTCPSVTLTTTTETTLCGLIASTFLDLAFIECTNGSATLVRVDIRDATAGTVRKSMWLAANGGGFATPQGMLPWPQAAVGNNWTIQLSAAVTDVRCDAIALQNK